jgi:hypothetical protein
MAADSHGTLKCRIVLEVRWEADGTVDGDLYNTQRRHTALGGLPPISRLSPTW